MLFAIFLHAFSLRMGDHLRCHLLLELLAELEGMEQLHPEQELELPEELHLLEGMENQQTACHPAWQQQHYDLHAEHSLRGHC